MRDIWARIRYLFHRDAHGREWAEELDAHLQMEIDANIDRGMRPDDARQAARRGFGSPARLRESSHDAWAFRCLESIFQDLRYGLRQFRKTPGLTLAVVASLAIGLGANTAIFSLIDAAVLRPLPVADPGALVQLEWRNDGVPDGASMNCGSMSGARNDEASRSAMGGDRLQLPCVSQLTFRAFAERQTAFAGIVGTGNPADVAVSAEAGTRAEQLRFLHVSANFFDELGVRLEAGRPFLEEEDRPDAEPVVIVSHRFWSGSLGRDAAAVGDVIRINDEPARIVGVAPAGFFGITPGEWIDVYRPLGGEGFSQIPGFGALFWGVDMVARLAPGVSASDAAAAMTPLFRGVVAETMGTRIGDDLELVARGTAHGLYEGDDVAVSRALWILMLLVGVLLLIVSANVANLLLARAVGRRSESAVRLALGAGRRRLIGQHLVESAMLAAAGGAAGLALGGVLAGWLHAIFQTGQPASEAFAVALDGRVFLYAAAISTLTAMIFGLAPAWTAARSEVGDALKVQSRSVSGGGLRLPKILVSVQFALSFAALVAAGLLGRSLENLYATDLGFDGEQVAYATVRPGQAGYSAADIGAYQERLAQEIAAVPGVLAVAHLFTRPLDGGHSSQSVETRNGPPAELTPGVRNPAAMATLSSGGPGFIEVLGLRLLAGRPLEPHETCALFRSIVPDSEAAVLEAPCPVVVDQRFAEVFFPGEIPVGQTFNAGGRPRQIVGLVANARHGGLRGEPLPTQYLQLDDTNTPLTAHFAIRAGIDPYALVSAVGQAVARVDPAVPLAEFHTQSDLIDRMLRTERLLAFVSGGFSLAAVVLAAVGLGGLLAYAVARRANEIGIRMALGASEGDVRRMVLGDALRMVGVGILLGVPAAWAVGRYLESQLFGLGVMDALTASVALAVLMVIALPASYGPAIRATRVDPLRALREE